MKKSRNSAKKAEKKEIRRQGKRSDIITVVTVTIIVALMAASMYFLDNMDGKVVFRNVGNGYFDPDTGITYYEAPSYYEPLAVYDGEGEEYGEMDGDRVLEIDKADKKTYLCRETKTSGGVFNSLYVKLETVLPSLSEFETDKIYICTDGITVSAVSLITDGEDIEKIVSEITQGEKITSYEAKSEIYTLRFASSKYPYIYYCVKYVVTEDISYYVDVDTGDKYEASSIINEAINDARA